MRRLFLADVHLSPREPARTERLIRFLAREAARADEIYILGDLFDYWIGPKHLALGDYREALEALRRVARERPVFFLIGNRDFYMSRGFEESTGIRVVPGRTERARRGSGGLYLNVPRCSRSGLDRVYLCHGDYLEGRTGWGFRIQEFIRSPGFERQFIRLPARVAKAMAGFYRWLSNRKPRRSCRMSDGVLEAEFRRGADIVVCGHFHEAQRRTLQVDGREAVLFTVGDWSEGESFLAEEDGRWELHGGP
ncbi:MAG: UDP-2,3-diacylglucosamine diphosphatase [Planctomycetes bacterium]|nr:UDP-2,3-diacylglucosamine diphosphatase [Planctomycetota bacterium]